MNFLAGAVCIRPPHRAEAVCSQICGAVGADWQWSLVSSPGVCFATPSFDSTVSRRPSTPNDGNDSLRIAGNIRIDNRSELLTLLGWTSREEDHRSDQDVFAACWVKWREAALDRIVGAFAVAIWDQRQQSLILVRDHSGEMSLFFLHQGEMLAFASLPIPLRSIDHVDTSLDEEQCRRYLALLSSNVTPTLFKNISKLQPGHLLTFGNGAPKVVRYWHPSDAPAIRYRRDEEYVEAFRDLFDRAVLARLRTDGRIGSGLSGGMDSASVTSTAARLLGNEGLTAFTAIPQKGFAEVGPAGRFGNEGPAAALLAAMYGNIEHVLVEPSAMELVAGLNTVESQGVPVLNPTNHMWTNAILNQCRERGITVLLYGTCGNATLSASGLIGLTEMLRKGNVLALVKAIYLLRKRSYTGFRRALSMATAPVMPSWLQRRLSPDEDSFSFAFSPLRPDSAARYHLREQSFHEMFDSQSSVNEYRRKTFEYFDPGPSNAAVSVAWDIEMRDPTQDKRIFDFCYSIPIEQYLAGGQTRSLVRRAMRGRVPDATLDCRDRGLQAADWYLTMGARRQEMLDELALIRLSPMANRLLDLNRLQYLLENWPTSGFETQEVIYSWHLALSRGISAGHFIRRYE